MNPLISYLETLFPPELAESWDNVGLLLGDPQREFHRVMTCLTVTPEVVAEAVEEQADLIVSHHPFPFHAVKRITTETPTGKMLWDLVGAKIAVYSPHTAHDNAETGINQQLAEMLELVQIEPLTLTSGRIGLLPQPVAFADLVEKVRQSLCLPYLQYIDSGKTVVSKVAIGCGAAGEFLEHAAAKNADVLLLGEARFHTCLEAQGLGVALILPGHYASERFAMERLADRIAAKFPELRCWSSNREKEPIQMKNETQTVKIGPDS
ncbi:MAG: Nif3-like dinuclear metal center hexameric protein [Planctomycetaceae bacterium]|nr:Nif3-like dinuclear metal center hexameric protein [Planctomycetaceae bacterium]